MSAGPIVNRLAQRARFKLTGWQGSMRLVLQHPLNRGHRMRSMTRLAGWQLWRLTVRRPLTTRFWNDIRIRAYPNSPASGAAICTGLPDYDEMLFTLKFLRRGETFVDVGANVGLYSLLAASVLPDGAVIAIEPDPVAADRLAENARLNDFNRISIRQAAAGAAAGAATLTADLDVMNHVIEGVCDRGTISQKSRVVTLTTLDDETRATSRVSLIKIDAEGYETRVLRGASGLLALVPAPVWIVEVNGFGSRYGFDDAGILEIFAANGYRAFRYEARANRLLPAKEISHGTNLIFSREVDEIRSRLDMDGGLDG